MEEEWRPVVGFEDRYIVSSTGRVFSLPRDVPWRWGKTKNIGNMEMGQFTRSGYFRVCLSSNNRGRHYSVHRLVAVAFLPNPNNLPQINHIDGNKANNCVSNLEWVTRSENVQHAYDHGLIAYRKGEDHYKATITDDVVREIWERLTRGEPIVKIAASLGTTTSIVSAIKHNVSWKHLNPGRVSE